jgi:acetylxylan esterase
VNTNATLTHNGGSDSLGLINAVRYAIANWGINPNQVFVTGSSSGAMMTNVMAGAYPDVFKAGAVDSGVPYGCFEGASSWNSQCAQGQLIKTAQQWVSGRIQSAARRASLLIGYTRGRAP